MQEEVLEGGDSPVFLDMDSEAGDDGHSTGMQELDAVEQEDGEEDTTAHFTPTQPLLRASRSSEDNFSDLLKYTLATSCLLTPKLAAALPLYPTLDATRAPPKDAPATLELSDEAVVQAVVARESLDWGLEWDVRGHEWRDREALVNGWMVVCWVVVQVYEALLRLRPPPTPLPSSAPPPTLSPTLDSPSLVAGKPSKETLHKSVIKAMEDFVRASQEMDIRIARALGAIREIEVISFGLGL